MKAGKCCRNVHYLYVVENTRVSSHSLYSFTLAPIKQILLRGMLTQLVCAFPVDILSAADMIAYD